MKYTPCVAAISYPLLDSVSKADYDAECGVFYSTDQQVTNWSSTHSSSPARIYEPHNAQECLQVLQVFHNRKQKIRPVGTALSPNGLGLSSGSDTCMLSLKELDSIRVDTKLRTVTVGAGATVSAVLQELKKHGLTLENFSSIQEQQMGGWTQVSAHGTGIRLPPVDEMILHMQIATPTEGLLSLSDSDSRHIHSAGNSIHASVNDHLFRLCKVGLGSLGVVTRLTLKCIPCMDLEEHTSVSTRAGISGEVVGETSGKSNSSHAQRLWDHRHVRYMWIPYTDTVVCVVSNPVNATAKGGNVPPIKAMPLSPAQTISTGNDSSSSSKLMATQAMCNLLESLKPSWSSKSNTLQALSFSQLRDELLDLGPLNLEHVKAVNAAEAEFWKHSAGSRVDDSTNVLGFDCGGEQWVHEVCLPIGTVNEQFGPNGGRDLEFVRRLLDTLEKAGVPAPSPIEQRWTARSTAPMSPAYSSNPDDLFTWVGIIMYLPPSQSAEQRKEITDAFNRYTSILTPLLEEFGAVAHWAKIELPAPLNHEEDDALVALPVLPVSKAVQDLAQNPAKIKTTYVNTLNGDVSSKSHVTKSTASTVPYSTPRVEHLRQRLQRRYDTELFNSHRRVLDPHNILSNELVDTLLPAFQKQNPPPAWKRKANP